ncbi:MAG TPA: hypothetical protein VGM30_10205 [Puia sp.]|jgi:hypothetical protein
MRSILIFTVIILSAASGRAQQVIDLSKGDYEARTINGDANSAVGGLVFSPVKFVRVTAGTPFFKEEWLKGTLVLDGGKAFANLWLRINLLDNEINYKDAAGREMVASSPVIYVLLTDSTTGKKYDFVRGSVLGLGENLLSRTLFQILVNEKVSLCKQMNKKIHETPTYGSATTEQDIMTIDFYYVRMNGNLSRFKWDDWQELFKDKKDVLAKFIKENHLKGKSDEDYIKLVKYYNTL